MRPFRENIDDDSASAISHGPGAHSGERDRPFRPKVITGSGDRDHADASMSAFEPHRCFWRGYPDAIRRFAANLKGASIDDGSNYM
jgi:hypothetical protein